MQRGDMQRGGQHRTRSNNNKVSGAGGRGRQSEPARVHAISCDLVRSRRGSLRATRTMAAVSHRIYPVAAAVAATMAGRPVPAHDRIYPPVPPYGRPLYVGTGLDSRHAVMHRLVRPPKMRVCTQVRTCRAVCGGSVMCRCPSMSGLLLGGGGSSSVARRSVT